MRLKCYSALVASLGACVSLVLPLRGADIPGLYHTGVDNAGSLLQAGAVDPHWVLAQSSDAMYPGPNAIVGNEGWPILPAASGVYIANGPDSKWIAPRADFANGNLEGNYTYRLTFDLAGLEPDSAILELRYTSDNSSPDVRINNVSTGYNYDGNFGAFSATFIIDSGFVDGLNTLDVVVNNATGPQPNPTAFRAEVTGTADLEAPPGTPAQVTESPEDAAVGFGDAVSFTVGVYGSKPISYQWHLNSDPIPGATNRFLLIPAVSAADVGNYTVLVSNAFGSDLSDPASLSVSLLSPAELTYEPLGPTTRRTALVFSEVMYHPADRADGRNVEFVEIYNSNPFFEDLSGYRLSGQIDYTFPEGTTIEGNGFLVLASAPADIEAVYGISGVLGGFTNRLDNAGGNLRLRKRSGAVILDMAYQDSPAWPAQADGKGHSLVLARPSYGPNDPRSWEASDRIGGSPSAPDPVPSGLLENVVLNEILAHTDLPLVDFVELYNHSPVPIDISLCWLSDDRDTNKFQIPAGTILPPRGFLTFDQDQLGFALAADGEDLYLVTPDQQRVLDMLRFDGQANGVSYGRFPDGASGWQELALPTAGTTNAAMLIRDVVINEIMYNPISGDEDDEYIELHNRGAGPADVGGWRFVDGIDFALPPGTSIPGGAYLVVARNAARLLTNYPSLTAAQVVGDYGGNLANGGERIAIAMPDVLLSTNAPGVVTSNTFFIVVDEVTYVDGGRWGRWSDGGGSSLELIDARSDNRLAANWADSDESAKAPWTLVEHTGLLDFGTGDPADQLQLHLQGAGEALVDDVEVFPAGGANRIANPGFESSTTGWFFQGTHRLTSQETSEGYNSARSLHVRGSDRGDQNVNRVRAPLSAPLSANSTGTIRARVRWLRGHPEMLLRLKENYLEVVAHMDLPAHLGTPGAPNSAAQANIGPAISEVGHRPALPAANQPIRVSARLHDPDRVGTALLRYRIDPGATIANIPLRDDGDQGDPVAGDGEYTALIPGQPAGTLVAFWIECVDVLNGTLVSRFPQDAPTLSCLVRVGEFVPEGAFGTYRFWITQATHAFWSSRERMSNESLDCTFVYGNNRIIYNASAHYAGSAFTSPGYNTPTGNLCGYDILYPDDQPFLDATHVILDWPVRDSTNQREQFMFWLLDQYDLPNLYRRYVHLFVNGVRRGTIYDDVQQPGDDVIEEWFPDDAEGSLYKTDYWFEFSDNGDRENGAANTLQDFSTTGGVKKTARYRWGWKPRATDGTFNDFGALFDLVDAANSQGPAYIPIVESVVDMEHWMRTFAMHDIASYWDAFGNPNYKNTYLYKPRDGGWKQFSWDFDVGLGAGINIDNERVNAPLFAGGIDPVVQRMYDTPAFVRAYWRALEEGVNTFFTAETATPILQAKYQAFLDNGVNLTSPFVPSGPFGYTIPGFITQRRDFILQQLVTVAATFAVDGPDSVTNTVNLILLTGSAPVGAKSLLVNGTAYPVEWTTVTDWRMWVPLVPGLNTLTLTGVDRHGTLLPGATRTLSVTFEGTSESPADVIVINEIMYHPATQRASFIELHNTSPTTSFDLSGWRVNGIDYTFPPGSVITNGQYLVLAQDPVAFGRAFGNDIPVFGIFDGNLDNGGETLTLLMPGVVPGTEVVVDRVTYDDAPPWPGSADGLGPSLQLIDAAQDNNRVSNWSDGQGWRFFSWTANVGSSGGSRLSFYFETSGGDLLLDDISFVEGSVPGAGPNILANGGFEQGLDGWGLGPLATNNTMVISDDAHSGDQSLHLVIAPGALSLTTFFQVHPAVTTSADHTLSFWYKPGTQVTNFYARLNSLFRPMLMPEIILATPGAPNGGTGTLPPYPPLWLSEVQPNNQGELLDNEGDADPWIEIHNSGATPIALDDLWLANDLGDLDAWPFPAGAVIQPGEYRLLWADGQPGQSDAVNWHTPFRLNPTNGIVTLSRSVGGAPLILDYLAYDNLILGQSYGAHPPGQSSFRQAFYFPTPGQANNPAFPPAPLFINEWMASNTGSVLDPADQDADDWFEIYNPNPTDVDLAGHWITDNPGNPIKFIVPSGFTVPAGGFLIVWADEEQSQASLTGELHVNFRLGASGETIILRAPDGTLLDSVQFGAQASNVSEGRYPDGAAGPHVTLTAPTPAAPNVYVVTTSDIVIQSVAHTPTGLMLSWSAQAGVTYQVQYKDSLDDPNWTDLPGGSVQATGDTATFTDTTALAQPRRFYQVISQ